MIRTIDKTQPKACVIMDASNRGTVMPVLELLNDELKVHGLEFVITKDTLANGNVVEMVEISKKQIKRTRRSRKGGLLG